MIHLSSEDWIIQEAVSNCSDIASVFNGCTNSFRVLTVIKGTKISVVYCSLKFGRGVCATDNAHTGGVYVGVNLESGELDSTAYDEDLNEYTEHPTTGIRFQGIKIKNIQELLECAKKCAAAYPDITVAGWDIVLSPTGPIVLEGNSSSGLTIFQRPFQGLQALLRILAEDGLIDRNETCPRLRACLKKL
jgi:hypothetical protein